MTTKPSSVGMSRGIYDSPFDAFTNYMNILGDFINRVNSLYPEDIDNDELNGLLTTIKNQEDEMDMKEKEIIRLQTKLNKIEAAKEKDETKTKAAKAKSAKAKKPKSTLKKSTKPKEEEQSEKLGTAILEVDKTTETVE